MNLFKKTILTQEKNAVTRDAGSIILTGKKLLQSHPDMIKIFPKITSRLLLAQDFENFYVSYRNGYTGKVNASDCTKIPEDYVTPYAELKNHSSSDDELIALGNANKSKFVKIVLNGGLATTLHGENSGLMVPKTLIPVDGNEVICDKLVTQAETEGYPLLFFNSLFTDQATRERLSSKPHNVDLWKIIGSVFPRINAATKELLCTEESDPDNLKYYAPLGHLDYVRTLAFLKFHIDNNISSSSRSLAERGIEWALVSNGENIGATFDPKILGYMIKNKKQYAPEVIRRSPAFIKGGLPVMRKNKETGNTYFSMVESAQRSKEDDDQFNDISKFPYFNTGNVWVHLPSLQSKLENVLLSDLLPFMINEKTINGKKVVQFEQSKDHIIEVFGQDCVDFIEVNYSRFFQVKHTSDILLLRSNFAQFNSDGTVKIHEDRDINLGNPELKLDNLFFGTIDEFNKRVSSDAAKRTRKLKNIEQLGLVGDFRFGQNIRLSGKTILINALNSRNGEPIQIELGDKEYLPGIHVFTGTIDNWIVKKVSDFDQTIFDQINTPAGPEGKDGNGSIIEKFRR